MSYSHLQMRRDGSRLMPGGNRNRLVDCAKEFVKYTIIMRTHCGLFNDTFSERIPIPGSHCRGDVPEQDHLIGQRHLYLAVMTGQRREDIA